MVQQVHDEAYTTSYYMHASASRLRLKINAKTEIHASMKNVQLAGSPSYNPRLPAVH